MMMQKNEWNGSLERVEKTARDLSETLQTI